MNSKKRLLRESPLLYAIADKTALGNRPLDISVMEMVKGGTDIIQYRDKESDDPQFKENALLIKKVTDKTGTIFIINDRINIAEEINADGIHLGQDDIPIADARKMLGHDKIIGLSTHNIEQVKAIPEKYLDYIAIGPIFRTSTKPDSQPVGIKQLKKIIPLINLPFFVIGAINSTTIGSLTDLGIRKIAVITAITGQENMCKAAQRLKTML